MTSNQRNAHTAAILIWANAAGFGIPAIPCAHYLRRTGRLPSFFGLFRMYEGPAWQRVTSRTYVGLLYEFALLCLLEAIVARLVWRRRRTGAILSLLLLPAEAAHWVAFALPLPPISAAARLVFIARAWKDLR